VSEELSSTADPEYGGGSRLEELAAENAFALRDTAGWLHRRVEHLSWTDRRTLRWQFSVDFTIPRDLEPFREEGGGASVFFVPVALLRKWPPLSALDLRDENGHPIPLLTSIKNRQVDAAVLVALAPPGYLRDQLEEDLRNVSLLPSKQAEDALASVSDALKAGRNHLTDEQYARWSQAGEVAATVTSSSILWVRVVGQVGERHIVKCSFEHFAETELKLRRRFFAAFSWGPARYQYELANLGERGSYHLEITPPPGLQIRGANLTLQPRPSRQPLPPHARGVIGRRLQDLGYLAVSLYHGVSSSGVVPSAQSGRETSCRHSPEAKSPPAASPTACSTRSVRTSTSLAPRTSTG